MTESTQPLILVTNDDGIASPGLHAAIEAVADLGELFIVAPRSQRTGAGRSYLPVKDHTLYPVDITIQDRNNNEKTISAYTAEMTPAQVVSLAIKVMIKRPVDLCISGINYGENLGSGITISGTVGAAIEAACFDIPALAMSLQTAQEFHLSHSDEIDFTVAAHFTRLFAQQILEKKLPPDVDLLKVDVPDTATPQTPWKSARVSRRRYYEMVHGDKITTNERGELIDYEARIDRDAIESDSDVYVFGVERLVSVVPLTIDLTAPIAMETVMDHFDPT